MSIKKFAGAAFCRPLAVLAALALSAMLVVGCGDDGEDDGGGNPPANGTPGAPLNVGGQIYRTVIIGGKTWMAENLNRQTSGSWCYDDDPANCAIYGRLYTWDAAMSACPSGWRLPSDTDWKNLMTAVGGVCIDEEDDYCSGWEGAGTKLKSQSGWHNSGNGTDDFGFAALPGGNSAWEIDYFDGLGGMGVWWTATSLECDTECDEDMNRAQVWIMDYESRVGHNYIRKDRYAVSVRCVKN